MMGNRANTRSGRMLLIVLLSITVLLALVVAWVWSRSPAQPSVAAGRAVCDTFLAQLQNKQADQAWQSTTAEFKSALGREKFLTFVKEHPFLTKPLGFVSVQTVTVNSNPRTEYLYRAANGKQVRLLSGQENGAWHIDRLTADGT